MEILLATHNDHKAEEVRKIMPSQFQLATLNDIQYFTPIIEDGDSFRENAWIKSRTAFEVSELPTFSDDSGLCVQALDGAPGIHSARYSETGKSEDNIKKLLEALKGKANRNAYFICVICFYDGTLTQFFEGRLNGVILEEERGKEGFGYDPIFIPDGYDQTLAEMPSDLKNKISHRTIALGKLVDFLKKY